jgi:hypothetical protein
VSKLEFKDTSLKEHLKKLIPKIFEATIVSVIVGACLILFWLLFSAALARLHPEYQLFFAVFAWAMVLFAFAVRVADGTIFKYCFIIGRAFFLIIYIVYVTNGGILTLDFMKLHFTLEFIPLLALMILINLLTVAKGVLQALQFTSESPKE